MAQQSTTTEIERVALALLAQADTFSSDQYGFDFQDWIGRIISQPDYAERLPNRPLSKAIREHDLVSIEIIVPERRRASLLERNEAAFWLANEIVTYRIQGRPADPGVSTIAELREAARALEVIPASLMVAICEYHRGVTEAWAGQVSDRELGIAELNYR